MPTKSQLAARAPVVGEWAGEAQYRCPFCAYDSLDEATTRAHIDEQHPLPPPKAKSVPAEPPANDKE